MPFKNTKLDYAVFIIALIVFIWAFFFDSFRPMLDENGEPIIVNNEPVLHINMQVFLAPIILIYEMFILLAEGKPRLRELPWKIMYINMIEKIREKIKEGKKQYKTWKK